METTTKRIELNLPESTNDTIKLTDDISVELGYPTFGDLAKAGIDTGNVSAAENLFKMITYCFKTVITEDEKFILKDHSEEEITAFIDSMDAGQFSKVREFIENIPRLKKDFELTCTECNHVTKNSLEGLANFLS